VEVLNPFALPGRWYKGNLHTHTTGSDGTLDANAVAARYREAGYDFLALTDHDAITSLECGRERESFLVLPGAEISARRENGQHVDVLCFGLSEAAPVPERPTAEAAAEWARQAGGECLIAHPHLSQITPEELCSWPGALGIEVFNASCHYAFGKGYSCALWDTVLSRGQPAWGFASDDSHHHFNDHRPDDLCQAWVSVRAPRLGRTALLGALRRGHFYSSWGPAIEALEVTDDRVKVRTSPVKVINFLAPGFAGESFTAVAKTTITEAEYRLRGSESYLRIECWDAAGRGAWSNPVISSDAGTKK
jgi:hypothetical protein